MEIKNVYWRREAITNLKEVFAAHQRYKRKTPLKELLATIEADIEYLKESPFRGYLEPSLMKVEKKKKIFSHFINKSIRLFYYTEKENMYIIDFWHK